MRYLVVSDSHGNRFGLEAVLAASEGHFDTILCLGDIVGYGAHPNECCDLLRQREAVCLMGNHDAAALDLINLNWFNPIARQAALWTREQLTPENRAWLGSLPPRRDFETFQAVHGSLREPLEEYINDFATIEPNLLLMERSLCFFGHTHVAVVYCAPERAQWKRPDQLQGASLTFGGLIEPDAGINYLVNPGSCGQPRDGNAQARYALYDTESGVIDVRAVDYDVQAARKAIIRAGLPGSLGDRLLTGQ